MSEAATAPSAPPGAASPAPTRNPFASAGYLKWWLASIIAGSGVGIQAVTVPLFVRDRVAEDQRAAAIAAALISQTLPAALFALVGGVIADRVERRRILVRTYLVAAAVSLAYVWLSGFDVGVVWPVFLLAAVVGSAGAFTNPARSAMMPQILQREQIQNGVIFGTMAFMATQQFLGPTVGGLVADGAGLTVAFAAEVAMLGLAAFIFSRIATDRPVPTGRNVFGDLVDGLRYARQSSTIQGLLLMTTLPGLFLMGPFGVTVVLIVEDVMEASDKFVGLMWGAFGAGVFIGSVILTLRTFPRRGAMVCMSVFIGGMLMAAYGASSSLWLSLAILVVSGLCPAVFMNFAAALLQEHVEPRMMGRVMSMYGLAFTASIPIGYAQAGVVTSIWGPQTTMISSGLAASVIGFVCLMLLRPVTRLR